MSAKYYCDACGEIINRNYVSKRYLPSKYLNHKNTALEVLVCVDGTWNDGDICWSCLKLVFNEPDCEIKQP